MPKVRPDTLSPSFHYKILLLKPLSVPLPLSGDASIPRRPVLKEDSALNGLTIFYKIEIIDQNGLSEDDVETIYHVRCTSSLFHTPHQNL